MPASETLKAFAATGATLAIHLSIHVLDKVVAELTPFYGADCPAAVVYRASWPDERVIRGTLASIAAEVAGQPIERTALILVGKVLSARRFPRERALRRGLSAALQGQGVRADRRPPLAIEHRRLERDAGAGRSTSAAVFQAARATRSPSGHAALARFLQDDRALCWPCGCASTRSAGAPASCSSVGEPARRSTLRRAANAGRAGPGRAWSSWRSRRPP